MFLEALQIPNDSAAEKNAGCRQFQFFELADVRIPLDISHNGFPPRRQLPGSQTGHRGTPVLLCARPAILFAAARKIQHPPARAHWRCAPAHHHAADGRAVEHDDRE
ncbi:hypothetical protein V496_06766 [Pseudogymnoascus sp. VKM F-4515 (FW-2607)]|nr:hypothetical protein V496_06766 [Pseudogymnoascus sp. VKM F-4515 (FW-2607)]KFY83526.1 hypothetical protein V498_08011 [Pseudogymnoascus sp. VKM F-4517 (FW-2822)]